MDAIKPGLIGAAVEDVQQRLINLGASISDDERIAQAFGPTTAAAVSRQARRVRPCFMLYLPSAPR